MDIYTLMRKLVFNLIALLITLPVYAQFNIEDGEGRTSIGYSKYYNLGSVLFNTEDKKLKFDYYHYFNAENSGSDWIVGIAAEGKIKNDISTIFSGNNFTPESKLSAAIGFRFCNSNTDTNWVEFFTKNDEEKDQIIDDLSSDQDGWLFVRGSFTGSKFKLLNYQEDFSTQIEKRNFSGYEIDFGINLYKANFLGSHIATILGASIGPMYSNNFNDLTELSIENKRQVTDPNGTSREITEKLTAWEGKYKESGKFQAKIDLLLIPEIFNRIGILGFL